jgi:hypothetical protein
MSSFRPYEAAHQLGIADYGELREALQQAQDLGDGAAILLLHDLIAKRRAEWPRCRFCRQKHPHVKPVHPFPAKMAECIVFRELERAEQSRAGRGRVRRTTKRRKKC